MGTLKKVDLAVLFSLPGVFLRYYTSFQSALLTPLERLLRCSIYLLRFRKRLLSRWRLPHQTTCRDVLEAKTSN